MLQIATNEVSSFSLSNAVPGESSAPSILWAKAVYLVSIFSPFCPLMDLWKSIRIWARNLTVPVLVVAKLG